MPPIRVVTMAATFSTFEALSGSMPDRDIAVWMLQEAMLAAGTPRRRWEPHRGFPLVLGDDAPVPRGLSSVSTQSLSCLEIQVSFNRQAQLASDAVAEFWEAESQIAKAKGGVRVVGVDFGEQPRALSVRGEELDHGPKIGVSATVVVSPNPQLF